MTIEFVHEKILLANKSAIPLKTRRKGLFFIKLSFENLQLKNNFSMVTKDKNATGINPIATNLKL